MLSDRNNQAKKEIFASIRRNLAASAPFDALHHEHHIPQQSADSLVAESSFANNVPIVSTDSTETTLAKTFQENLTLIGGNCVVAENVADAGSKIKKIIEKLNAKKIAISNADLVGKTKNIFAGDLKILQNAQAEELFGCDLGITAAQFGIAETGTLVLEAEREFSRLTSLVPPVHICLLEEKNIRKGLGEVLQTLNAEGREKLSRTITFITGPSRTSDIELTLAIGVHGPAELHVIIVK